MNLHESIQNYINELQALLNETDEQKLINKAYKQWGEDDARYEVLEQFVESLSASRFKQPAKPAAPESNQGDGGQIQNKPVK
ncbi:MAG: hypothetical protein KAH84_06635 [Thiomargarita sp.]|nr:hypothetical protein [Thiomargarita sp.]